MIVVIKPEAFTCSDATHTWVEFVTILISFIHHKSAQTPDTTIENGQAEIMLAIIDQAFSNSGKSNRQQVMDANT